MSDSAKKKSTEECEFETVEIEIPYNFPLCVCPHCRQKFVVLGVIFSECEFTGEKKTRWFEQVNTNKPGMYCPYCGKKPF